MDGSNMHWPQQQARHIRVKRKTVDRDERFFFSGGNCLIFGEDTQTRSIHIDAIEDRDIESIQFDAAIEVCTQGSDDTCFQNRTGMLHYDLESNKKTERCNCQSDT